MAIDKNCDINLVIEKMGLNHCEYILNQSIPPHYIVNWGGDPNGTDVPCPTDEEINDVWNSIPYVNKEYIEKRIGLAATDGYLSMSDQLDQLYHDMTDGKLGVAATTGSWYVGITSVKLRYPK